MYVIYYTSTYRKMLIFTEKAKIIIPFPMSTDLYIVYIITASCWMLSHALQAFVLYVYTRMYMY